MGFSSIPLPKPVYDVGPGGGIVTGMQGVNALTQGNLQNQILKSQAQYAPYQNYANALLTTQQAQWLPYQYRMNALPMMLMSASGNPAMQQQIINSMAGAIPGAGNMPINMNIPAPNAQNNNILGNGILGTVMNPLIKKLVGAISGNPQQSADINQGNTLVNPSGNINPIGNVNNIAGSTNNILSSPASSTNTGGASPIVPATGGGAAGITGALTSGYLKSPYGVDAIPDPNNPGKVIYVPTTKTQTGIETQLLGQSRVEPQLQRLADEWAPFMDVKGMSDLTAGRIGQAFGRTISPDTLNEYGLSANPQLASQYAKAKATMKTAPEALVKAYGLNPTNETLDRLESAVEPMWGESPETYKQRILQTIYELKTEQEAPSKEALQQGFSSAPSNATSPQQTSQQGTVPPANPYISPQEAKTIPSTGAPVNKNKNGTSVVQATKVLDGVPYAKINGRWHPYG